MRKHPLHILRDTLMPPDLCCALCKSPDGVRKGHGVCTRCLLQMPRTHAPIFLEGKIRAIAPFLHEDGAAKLVYALKYGADGYAAYALSSFMAQLVQPYAGKDAVLVPVPQHVRRYLARGYNQSVYLAKGLSEKTGVPFCRALSKTRATAHQTGLSAAARRQNLQDAFCVKGKKQKKIRGKTILLIDDVTTTGATLLACAEALFCAGAHRVVAVTATRTRRHVPDAAAARFVRGAVQKGKRLRPVRI